MMEETAAITEMKQEQPVENENLVKDHYFTIKLEALLLYLLVYSVRVYTHY